MPRIAALLACALALSACSTSLPTAGKAYDPGGNVYQRAAQIAALERQGGAFVAPRQCMSACTMFLGLSTACFPADGWLGFHSARTPDDNIAAAAAGNLFMATFYPPRLARWFLTTGPGATGTQTFTMVAVADLVARGEARACA